MNRQTLEPKPARDVIDQVFLSPRVLDKAAFEEFASIVKQLIERASEANKALQLSAAQAEAVHKRLAEAAPIIESRLTGAGAAITTLDARTSEVRAALNKAAECALRAETAQVATERLAGDAAAQVESRITVATQSGQNSLENARATVEVRASEIAETALRAIEAAGQRLEDLEAQSAARLTEVVEQASQSIRVLEDRLNQITGRIASLTGAGLGGISALCDRATAILGYDPSAAPTTPPSDGSLGAAVQRLAASSNGSYQGIDPTEPNCGPTEEPVTTPARRATRKPKVKKPQKATRARKR